MEVLHQWQHGIVYPRWAEFAQYSYGEARFLFYPPFSWTLGAALGALLPWKMVPGAYIFLALSLSGCSMFLLARTWLNRNDAIFAAAFYADNPYVIVVVYWRSAFAELLAGALYAIYFGSGAPEEGRRTVIPLVLIVAAAWMTNAPAAVMVNHSLALINVAVAIVWRSPRIRCTARLVVTLGAALAAFTFARSYEEQWVNIAQVLAPGVRPQDNFLFTLIKDADHNRFNLLISIVAIAEMVALAGISFSRTFRKLTPLGRWALMTWAAAAVLLMLPFTLFAWELLPKLRFVQLPWRWLSVVLT